MCIRKQSTIEGGTVTVAYEFTKDLETGNRMIDQEHRELIQAINDLLAACGKGQGRAEVVKTAQFLQSYTNKHFSDEERLQIQSKYPAYSVHKKYHEAFKKTVTELVGQLSDTGPTVAIVGRINTALAGWLINHIKQEDKKFAAYLRAKG